MRYYGNGTLSNPFMESVMEELNRIIIRPTGKVSDFELMKRDRRAQWKTRSRLLVTLHTLYQLRDLLEDVMKGFHQADQAVNQRSFSTNESTVPSLKFPKLIEQPEIIQNLRRIKKQLTYDEQFLRKMRFSHASTTATTSHMMVNVKKIALRYGLFFGGVTNFVKLIEKYEEGELCREEIMQVKMMILKFRIYVRKSQTDDLISFERANLEKGEFISKRIPFQWLNSTDAYGWDNAVNFLYRQATQEDSAFDYLSDLTVGFDVDTRIPLSVDALYFLSLERQSEDV